MAKNDTELNDLTKTVKLWTRKLNDELKITVNVYQIDIYIFDTHHYEKPLLQFSLSIYDFYIFALVLRYYGD